MISVVILKHFLLLFAILYQALFRLPHTFNIDPIHNKMINNLYSTFSTHFNRFIYINNSPKQYGLNGPPINYKKFGRAWGLWRPLQHSNYTQNSGVGGKSNE